METAGSDFKKVRRILLYAFVIFVLGMHLTREVASRTTATPDWLNWTSTIGASTIQSLDRFRRGCGDTFQKGERICPESAQGPCHTAFTYARKFMGM